jgi:thiol-disulfide isomerase/thioredoxin
VGRLPALALALALGAGCDQGKEPAPSPPPAGGRMDAVAAATTGGAAKPPVAPKAAAAPRKLCEGQRERPAPKGALRTMSVPGAASLPSSLPIGVGKWVWINLWAAWCAPCKEEMPRLQAFQGRLRQGGVLVDLAFVSLDDDERQLQRFLEAQPATGVRASYWLPDGAERPSFLTALGLPINVELPVQALVAPSGQVSCVVQGAIEDGDYAAIAALMGAKPSP